MTADLMKRAATTASSAGSAPGAATADVAVVNRLTLVAASTMGMAVVATVVALLAKPNVGGGLREGTARPHFVFPITAALLFGLLMAVRARRVPLELKLDLSLVCLVACCFVMGLYRHWLPYERADVLRGISPVAATILGFSVLVPVAPRRMFVFAALAAAMDPLTMALTLGPNNPSPRPAFWLFLHAPTVVSTVAALLVARMIHRLDRAVKKAREMGSYHLVERLGEGGMGEVWRAEHHTLARPAAIKLVKAERLGVGADAAKRSDAVRRFEREAQTTALLTSAHTIEIYDFGQAQDGSVYYVMELLEGMDAQALVDQYGPLPQGRVVSLLLQVCHSLQDAHDHDLIHRDIKPANIYVCRRGRDVDFVKVLDFGLVLLSRSADGGGDDPDAAKVSGTPAYMPPELARRTDIDGRADIYALGCVAFWMLTGQLVFQADNVMNMLAAHVMDAPRRPSEVCGQPIDRELERLVLKCLAKRPEDRPASCAELARELGALDLTRGWTQEDAGRWWEEHRPERRSDAVVASDAAAPSDGLMLTKAAEP